MAYTTVGFRMPQQPSPQHVQSGLAYTTVGHDLKSCRSIYYSHPRTLSKVDWHYYGGILDASTTPRSKGSKITKISSCRPGLGMLRSSNLAVVYTNRSRRSPAAGRRPPVRVRTRTYVAYVYVRVRTRTCAYVRVRTRTRKYT